MSCMYYTILQSALHCTTVKCTTLNFKCFLTALNCTEDHRADFYLYCTFLKRSVLNCIVINCTVLCRSIYADHHIF